MKSDLFTENEAKQVFEYLSTGDNRLSKDAEYKLYCNLMNEMPYGVAKGRTGTPDEWYFDYFRGYTDDDLLDWIDGFKVKQ